MAELPVYMQNDEKEGWNRNGKEPLLASTMGKEKRMLFTCTVIHSTTITTSCKSV